MPILCQLAELYLGMASSSVPVECLFSFAALIANRKRSSSKPYKLEHIIFYCSCNWLSKRFFAHCWLCSVVETVEHYLETAKLNSRSSFSWFGTFSDTEILGALWTFVQWLSLNFSKAKLHIRFSVHMIQHNKFANDCNHMYRAWLMKHWLFTLNTKILLAEKSAVNMSAKIQPKKIRLAENWAAFLKASQILPKNIGWGVYARWKLN